MATESVFDLPYLGMPFHFWSVVFLALGCIVGSFLNVVIHRLPLGQNLATPPSHCPHCNYAIPFYLNVPLVTWLYLQGKCANCKAPISVRYFLVELLTGVTFLACWLRFGATSAAVAVVLAIFLSGLIAGTFIDFEHFIIPDEITFGGVALGFLCSFLVPQLQSERSPKDSLGQSFIGIVVGAGLIYSVLRFGKLLFGKHRLTLPPDTKIVFTEKSIVLPGEEIPYEEVFYRKSDEIRVNAKEIEMPDRCYRSHEIRLRHDKLFVGEDEFDPGKVHYLEVITDGLQLPREAMGLGDVKFMAALGAFLGWQAVIFSLMASCIIGSAVGLTLIALKKESSTGRLAFVPYMAMGGVIWIFGGGAWWHTLWAAR